MDNREIGGQDTASSRKIRNNKIKSMLSICTGSMAVVGNRGGQEIECAD